jgi:hypothetical protein
MKVQTKQTISKQPSKGKPINLPINPEVIHRACIGAVDATELVYWYLVELSSLFESIKALENNEFSTVNRLAELGKYLCADWANTADCAREDVARHVEVLHSMLYPKGETNV